MRTTVRINEELLREAKLQAARQGTTLTAIIEGALRESLARQRDTKQRQPVRLVTFGGKGLLLGCQRESHPRRLPGGFGDRIG